MGPVVPECVQVKIEIGHSSICRSEVTHDGYTHDWIVTVRGVDGCNIANFVDKVVFHLHESFPKPKRIIRLPPYKVSESGYGSFLLPIEIYFKNKEEPKKVRFEYDLFLQLVGNPPVNNSRIEALTFRNPVEEFKKKLLKGGGVVVSPSGINTSVASPPGLPSVPLLTKPEASAPTPLPVVSPSALTKKAPKTSPTPSSQPNTPVNPKPPKLKETPNPPSTGLGVKRPSVTDDPINSQKTKKKKTEKVVEPTNTRSLPKEIAVINPTVSNTEKEKIKLKLSTGSTSKKPEDVKERKRSVEGGSNTPVTKHKISSSITSKDSSIKEHKPKEIREKVKKEKPKKSPIETKPKPEPIITPPPPAPVEPKAKQEPKVQKLTVKRTSCDAWSAQSAQLAASAGFNTSSQLDAFFEELRKDDTGSSYEDDVADMQASFQQHKELNPGSNSSNASETRSKSSGASDIHSKGVAPETHSKTVAPDTHSKIGQPETHSKIGQPETHSKIESHIKSTPLETPTKGGLSETHTKSSSNKPKKDKVPAKTKPSNPPPTNISKIDSVHMNGVKKKEAKSPPTLPNGKTNPESSILVQLWRKISMIEDSETLQKIVDIVETTGNFEITDSTFDFDLCSLDGDTIGKLQESLLVN